MISVALRFVSACCKSACQCGLAFLIVFVGLTKLMKLIRPTKLIAVRCLTCFNMFSKQFHVGKYILAISAQVFFFLSVIISSQNAALPSDFNEGHLHVVHHGKAIVSCYRCLLLRCFACSKVSKQYTSCCLNF